jgi:hypothetical protein
VPMVVQVTSLFSGACVMSISDKGLMLRLRCSMDMYSAASKRFTHARDSSSGIVPSKSR